MHKPSTLFLAQDLPYFPGKMGVDFFNLRYLAQTHRVGVVGPRYEIVAGGGDHHSGKNGARLLFLAPKRCQGTGDN